MGRVPAGGGGRHPARTLQLNRTISRPLMGKEREHDPLLSEGFGITGPERPVPLSSMVRGRSTDSDCPLRSLASFAVKMLGSVVQE